MCGNAEKMSAESEDNMGGFCCVALTHIQQGGELFAERELGSSDAGAETCVGASVKGETCQVATGPRLTSHGSTVVHPAQLSDFVSRLTASQKLWMGLKPNGVWQRRHRCRRERKESRMLVGTSRRG